MIHACAEAFEDRKILWKKFVKEVILGDRINMMENQLCIKSEIVEFDKFKLSLVDQLFFRIVHSYTSVFGG